MRPGLKLTVINLFFYARQLACASLHVYLRRTCASLNLPRSPWCGHPAPVAEALRVVGRRVRVAPDILHRARVPSPVTRFFEGGRVSQTLDGMSKTLFDST